MESAGGGLSLQSLIAQANQIRSHLISATQSDSSDYTSSESTEWGNSLRKIYAGSSLSDVSDAGVPAPTITDDFYHAAAQTPTELNDTSISPIEPRITPTDAIAHEILQLLCVLGFTQHLDEWMNQQDGTSILKEIWMLNRAEWIATTPLNSFTKALRLIKMRKVKIEGQRTLYTLISSFSQTLLGDNVAERSCSAYFELFSLLLSYRDRDWLDFTNGFVTVFISTTSVCINKHKKIHGSIYPIYEMLHTRDLLAKLTLSLRVGKPPLKGLMAILPQQTNVEPFFLGNEQDSSCMDNSEVLGWFSTATKSLAQHFVDELDEISEDDISVLLNAIAILSTQQDTMIKTHAHNALLTLLSHLDKEVAENFLCGSLNAPFVQSFCYNLSSATSALAKRRSECGCCPQVCADCFRIVRLVTEDISDYATLLRDVITLFDEGVQMKCIASIFAILLLPVWVRGFARDVRIVMKSKQLQQLNQAPGVATTSVRPANHKLVDPISARIVMDVFLYQLDSAFPELQVLTTYLLTSPNAPVCLLTHTFGLPFMGLSVAGLTSGQAKSLEPDECCCCKMGRDAIPKDWLRPGVQVSRITKIIDHLEQISKDAMRLYLKAVDVVVDDVEHHPAVSHSRHIMANPIRAAKLNSWTEGLSSKPREYTLESVAHALMLPFDILRSLRVVRRYFNPTYLTVMKMLPHSNESIINDAFPDRATVYLDLQPGQSHEQLVHQVLGWHTHSLTYQEYPAENRIAVSFPRESIDESEWLWNLLTSMFYYDQMPHFLLQLCFEIICELVKTAQILGQLHERVRQVANHAVEDLWHLCGQCGRDCKCGKPLKITQLHRRLSEDTEDDTMSTRDVLEQFSPTHARQLEESLRESSELKKRERITLSMLALGVELNVTARNVIARTRIVDPNLREWFTTPDTPDTVSAAASFQQAMLLRTLAAAKSIGTNTWLNAVEAATVIAAWSNYLFPSPEDDDPIKSFLKSGLDASNYSENSVVPDCTDKFTLFKCADSLWLALADGLVLIGETDSTVLNALVVRFVFPLVETYVCVPGVRSLNFRSANSKASCEVVVQEPSDFAICVDTISKRQYDSLLMVLDAYKKCF